MTGVLRLFGMYGPPFGGILFCLYPFAESNEED